MHAPLLRIVLSGAALLAWGEAHAQTPQDRYWFEVSAFWPDIDTSAAVRSANGAVATEISLESDLNLSDRKSLPAFFAGARLGRGFALTGEYFELNRDGSVAIERDITFDDVTFPVGAAVSSNFDTSVYRLSLAWSFVRRDRLEVGASLGAHVTRFDVGLSGQGFIGSSAIQTQARRRDVLAPLPTLGLYGSYQVTPRFSVGGRVDYMSLDVGDYDGSLTNTQLTATYRLFKNVGIGAMYRYVDYGVGIDKDDWQGDLAYTFSGPAVFLQAAF